MPKAVVSSVLRGIKHACRERGIKLMPKWMSFTNADFECYHLFERAAGHLVNHLVDNGQFGSLVIMQSKQ